MKKTKNKKDKLKVILRKTYKAKSEDIIRKELIKKKVLFKSSVLSGKKLKQVAKKKGIRLTTSKNVSQTKLTVEHLKLKKNTQLFVEYVSSTGHKQIISQLILSDNKAYIKRKISKLIKLVNKYNKNKIKRVSTKKIT